jgi:hypothetical protein
MATCKLGVFGPGLDFACLSLDLADDRGGVLIGGDTGGITITRDAERDEDMVVITLGADLGDFSIHLGVPSAAALGRALVEITESPAIAEI